MNNRSFKIAMLHISQTEETPDTDKVESPLDENKTGERLTLDQRKKAIDTSLESHYSPIINTFLRTYTDVGELMTVSQHVVSQFGKGPAPVEAFQKRVGNINIKILNAVGDTAVDDKNSLKQTFILDPAVTKMTEKEIDEYVREKLVSIKNDTKSNAKKIKNILSR
jgi:hypothetical protein